MYEGETWTINNRTLKNGLRLQLEITEENERPNYVYRIWTPSEWEAGVTVMDPRTGTEWKSCNYTPQELASDYAKQGRENAESVAYISLQRELMHYLYGNMYRVTASVSYNGRVLAERSIGFDFSEYDARDGETVEDRAREVAGDYFSYTDLVRRARETAGNLARDMASVAL